MWGPFKFVLLLQRKEIAQQENMEEAIQAQGMINLKPDAKTLRRLANMF